MSSFNANLRRIMKREKVGPTELGRRLGVHRNNIYRYMHVVKRPTDMTVWKLARALKVDPWDLDEDWEK